MPRLSSCCKCGPKGTATHEMGACPKLYEPPNAADPRWRPQPKTAVTVKEATLSSSCEKCGVGLDGPGALTKTRNGVFRCCAPCAEYHRFTPGDAMAPPSPKPAAPPAAPPKRGQLTLF